MSGSKSGASAINQDLIELYFVEKYHWLPQDIKNIPYKWIQKYFLYDKHRDEAIQQKNELENLRKSMIGQ